MWNVCKQRLFYNLFLDAKKVDSLNTLEKLIEHTKEICLGSRRFRTFKEMEQANFRVTYPDDAELYVQQEIQ